MVWYGMVWYGMPYGIDPGNNQHILNTPIIGRRKRHTVPHSAQSQHANYWAPRTRKRHQQEHRPQRPTESSDPTQHAKGRTGECPGPRKGATTRRNVTQGGVWYGMVWYALRYREWLAGRSLTLPVFRAGVRGQLAVTLGCCPPGSWGGGGGGCCCALPIDLPVPLCSCLLCWPGPCGPTAVRPCATHALRRGGGGAQS